MALYLSLNSFVVYTNFVDLPRLQHSLSNFEAMKSIDRCSFVFLKATFLRLKWHITFEILCKVSRERSLNARAANLATDSGDWERLMYLQNLHTAIDPTLRSAKYFRVHLVLHRKCVEN